MNEHRPPENKCLAGDKLAKVTDDLTSEGRKSTAWVDDAIKTAYAPIDFVKDTAQHAPIGTAITALGIGVGIYGAVKMGLPGRALAALGQEEILGGGTRALTGAAEGETLAGSEAMAAGTKGQADPTKIMVHLTTKEGAAGIANTYKIGSRWGVFAIDNAQVPANSLARSAASLVPQNLSEEIAIGPRASSYFKAPTPVGPFSLLRNVAGVKSTPLGSIDLARDAFIPNEIFSKGVFRPATAGEITKFKIHQYMLDYATDALGYTLAGVSTAALEYKGICKKADQKEAQWHAENLRKFNKRMAQDSGTEHH